MEGPNMTAPGTDATGIVVKARIFPLAFLLLLFKTNITVDGVSTVQRWGEHFFPVSPGAHQVTVSFRYLLGRAMGENSTAVEVAPGQRSLVLYRSPFLVFMRGSIKVGPAVTA
jgi:hypothetical protein